MIKKIIISIFVIINSLSVYTYWDDWNIIPEWSWTKAKKAVQAVWKDPSKVWKNYNEQSENMKDDVWTAFASWIFNWDTIYNFLAYIAKLLSWIGLVIWAGMIIYAWYKYAMWVFTADASKWWKDAVKQAIYWVLIIIFSYAIMKILLWMFW